MPRLAPRENAIAIELDHVLSLLRNSLAATFTSASPRRRLPRRAGQHVDASFIMSDAGWQSNCEFVSGPHPENNGYSLVKCGDTTSWTSSRWIRSSAAASATPAKTGVAASSATPARSEAVPVVPAASGQASVAANSGAVAPSGKACAAGSWADCTPAGSAPSTASHLPIGSYPCFLAGRASATMMRITSASTYTDNGGNPGSYSFDPSSRKITFTSGSLKGKNSKFLAGNKIGLTDNAENFYPTTCDLR